MKIRPYYPTFSEASRFPVKPFLLKSSHPPSFPHTDPTGETWQRPQPKRKQKSYPNVYHLKYLKTYISQHSGLEFSKIKNICTSRAVVFNQGTPYYGGRGIFGKVCRLFLL